MERCVVINVICLPEKYIGPSTPNLAAFAARGKVVPMETVVPAVTCTVQATLLTGTFPGEHGIVSNGWYFRDERVVRFWPQSEFLVERPGVWEEARRRDPAFTCAKLFWFPNMFTTVDYAVTPQPIFLADGRVLPGLYTTPLDLRQELLAAFGQFPIYQFWGPQYGIASSRWTADAAMWVEERLRPTLSFVFLPHLDFAPHTISTEAERIGKDLRAIDQICGELISFYEERDVRVIIVSEYGIVPVSRPVHLNRRFREQGWLAIREERGRDVLHPGGCRAFALVDQQVAHVYVNDPALLEPVRDLLAAEPGVAEVLDREGKRAYHLDHPRSGDLIALAEPDAWFTYYYWLDDERAPDYARTVDIFRKPGYDPLELYIDPEIRLPLLKYGWLRLKDKLGFRTLLDFIPLDASLIKASHGLITAPEDGPTLITGQSELVPGDSIHATDVHDLVLAHLEL